GPNGTNGSSRSGGSSRAVRTIRAGRSGGPNRSHCTGGSLRPCGAGRANRPNGTNRSYCSGGSCGSRRSGGSGRACYAVRGKLCKGHAHQLGGAEVGEPTAGINFYLNILVGVVPGNGVESTGHRGTAPDLCCEQAEIVGIDVM